MGLKFDVNKLIEYAKEYCPKFCNEFLSNFKNSKAIEVCVKLVIDFENDNYKFYCFGGFELDYINIIKDLGIYYGIYENEEEFEEDCTL